MRPIVMVLIAVALVVSGGVAFLAKRFIEGQTVQANRAAQAATHLEMVLVAARDIKPGQFIIELDVRYEKWPANVIDSRMTVKKGKDEPKTNFVGSVARRQIMSGEPLTQGNVFKPGKFGTLAGILEPGKRAMSINVTPASSVAGLAFPGDRVDVLLSSDMRKASDDRDGTVVTPEKGVVKFIAETVLQDVKLLAIDNALVRGQPDAKGKDTSSQPGKTVTLEVTSEQAEKLLAASMMGTLSVVLRSLAVSTDDPQEPRPGGEYTTDLEASAALRSLVDSGSSREPAEEEPKPRKSTGGGGGGGGAEVIVNRGGSSSSQRFGR
jgi:pilus assembly protein CpaB